MITVLRAYGLRIAIYTDDHPPPHVHVLGDGEAKIRLVGASGQPEVLQAAGMKKSDIAKALKVIAEDQAELLNLWRKMHG
jgi:hypothetical protein